MKADHQPSKIEYSRHSFTPARTLEKIPSFCEKLAQFLGQNDVQQQRQSGESQPMIGENERAFLDHLSLRGQDTVDVLFSRVGKLSSGAQQKIIRRLERLKLIGTVRKRTGKKYVRFAKLTKAGLKYLRRPSGNITSRGDLTHTCVCYLKRDLDLKQGAEESICESQYPNSSGFGDIRSKFKGKLHFSEIVVNCTSNIVDHVKSCFIESQGQVETLTIVTLLKSEHRKILERIMSVPELVFFINRIKFMTLEDILKELYEK
jgi:hypothetical protein